MFDNLLHRTALLIQCKTIHIEPVTAAEQLAITLLYMATGMSYRALSASYKLESATVGHIVDEVSRAIWTVLKDDFVTCHRNDGWKKYWKWQWQFPSGSFPAVLVSIEGKHVQIRTPGNSVSNFYNYKGYFSFILMECVMPGIGSLLWT